MVKLFLQRILWSRTKKVTTKFLGDGEKGERRER
jgi:hypothetical protein